MPNKQDGMSNEEKLEQARELFCQRSEECARQAVDYAQCPCAICSAFSQDAAVGGVVAGACFEMLCGRPEMLKEIVEFMDSMVVKYIPKPEGM